MNKKKNPQEIINQIEKIRKKNNSNWMDILRVAFDADPKRSSKILSRIYSDDKKISKLAKQLTKFK